MKAPCVPLTTTSIACSSTSSSSNASSLPSSTAPSENKAPAPLNNAARPEAAVLEERNGGGQAKAGAGRKKGDVRQWLRFGRRSSALGAKSRLASSASCSATAPGRKRAVHITLVSALIAISSLVLLSILVLLFLQLLPMSSSVFMPPLSSFPLLSVFQSLLLKSHGPVPSSENPRLAVQGAGREAFTPGDSPEGGGGGGGEKEESQVGEDGSGGTEADRRRKDSSGTGVTSEMAKEWDRRKALEELSEGNNTRFAENGHPFLLERDEKFMWYSAQSGFGNQVIQLSWALRFAAILKRTLIIPPKLPHFSSVPSIGRCNKRPTAPQKIRTKAWELYSSLLLKPGYVSMGDVLDLSIIPPSLARTIDFRHFVAKFCRCSVAAACQGPLCTSLSPPLHKNSPLVKKCLWECGAKLGGNHAASRRWEKDGSLISIQRTCGDTIWTIGTYSTLQEAVRVVGDKDPAMSPFAYENSRANRSHPIPRSLIQDLGPGSPASDSKVMAFASMFHPRIADINLVWPPPVPQIRNLSLSMPFTPPIMGLARDFVSRLIASDFVCMHVRGGDGFFSKLLSENLKVAEEKLRDIMERQRKPKAGPSEVGSNHKIPLFLMTDLDPSKWPSTLLARLPDLGFRVLRSEDIKLQIFDAGRATIQAEFGIRANRISVARSGSRGEDKAGGSGKDTAIPDGGGGGVEIDPPDDILLFVEQAICCHATLGIVSTSRSTASGFVHNLKAAKHCEITFSASPAQPKK